MEYVVSFFLQIVLALLMTVVFAFVLSLMVFIVGYIFSSPKNRSLNCTALVLSAIVGSVFFGLSLFAINAFVPYYCGVDYGYGDFKKVPLVADCSLISEDDLPFVIADTSQTYVDSISGLAVIADGVVSGRRMDDSYFIFNSANKEPLFCVEGDSLYVKSSIGKMEFENPNAYYYRNRDKITVEKTDYFVNWVSLITLGVALFFFLVFRFVFKGFTQRLEDFVERNASAQYEKIKDDV